MISESPVLNLLELDIWDAATGTWMPTLARAKSVGGQRGSTKAGASATVDVGTLTATFVDVGDQLTATLKPNMRVRIGLPGPPFVAFYTARILDLDTVYRLNKRTAKTTTLVTLVAVDAVSNHANITRYGAVTPGSVGYETWANRIIRLAESSATPINPPTDDNPIVRYAI